MARAPSSAGKAREGSSLPVCPVALARSRRVRPAQPGTCPPGWLPCTPRPTALCTSTTSWNCRPMLVPPVPRRCVADRARRTAQREGTRLRAGVPARGRERPPGGPLRRGGRCRLGRRDRRAPGRVGPSTAGLVRASRPAAAARHGRRAVPLGDRHRPRQPTEAASQVLRARYRSISALEHIEQCGGMGSVPPRSGTPPSESDSRPAGALVTGIFDPRTRRGAGA